jgi:hypothetical protein
LKKLDLLARLKHGLNRREDALLRLRIKVLLKLFGVKIFKYTELNYLGYSNSTTKVVASKVNASRNQISFPDSITMTNFSHDFSARFSLTAERVIVNTEKSLVYNDKRELLSDSTEWPPEHMLAFTKTPPNKIANYVASGRLGLANSGFYHWLTEDLPAFLNSDSDLPVLEFDNSNTRNRDVYKQLGLSTILVPEWISVNSLSFSTRGQDLGYLHPSNLQILREFADSIVQSTTHGDRKIYISRSRSRRSIPNEKLLEEYLNTSGYEIIFAEDLPFLEQIKIFSQARTIIAPHGAGLTNAIWSNGARILEICGAWDLNRCFEWQSKICGHDYTRFTYQKLIPHELVKFIDSWQHS